jgi:concanavalin A-like lectin/glucanase superfamily protein
VNSDYVTAPVTVTLGSSGFSASIWAWVNGSGNSGAGSAYFLYDSGTAHYFVFQMNGSTSAWRLFEVWSGATAEWTWTSPVGASAWQNIVLTHNTASTANVPIVYVNGVSQTVTTATPPSGTFAVTSIDLRNGNNTVTNNGFDGKLADVALWGSTILTATEAKSLAQGASPLNIRKASLSVFEPLCSKGLAQVDWGPHHYAVTATGTVSQLGPRTNGYPLLGFDGVN